MHYIRSYIYYAGGILPELNTAHLASYVHKQLMVIREFQFSYFMCENYIMRTKLYLPVEFYAYQNLVFMTTTTLCSICIIIM